MQIGRLRVQFNALDESFGPRRPSEAHARREQFGKRVEAEHAVVPVEGEKGWYTLPTILQPMVRIVLEDEQIISRAIE